MPHGCLIALLGLHVYLVVHDGQDYRKFQSLASTSDRQRYFKAWFFKGLVIYTGIPILILVLIGRFSTLWEYPAELSQLTDMTSLLVSKIGAEKYFSWIPGLSVAYLVMVLALTYLEHRESNQETNTMVNKNLQPMVPLNSKERFWTTLLSVNAGIGEEICFRLLVPLSFVLTLGNPILVTIFSVAWFGVIHLYQGIAGVFATSLLAFVLVIVYFQTQNLWLAVLLHVTLNTAQLCFAPWLAEHLKRGE